MKIRKNKPEPMVLYRCPYCGQAQLKSLYEIENLDKWCCTMCGTVMITAF